MAGPSKPSTKGYNPIPTEERIDDGVEEPNQEHEDNDDERLYTSSAPLLSSRTRGNEPPTSERRLCWYHKMARWRPFRRDQYDSWELPKKRNWRKILLWSFISFLVAAVIGLSISTGVLAGELDHRSHTRCYNNDPTWRQHTRLPFNKEWISSNNRLNFVRVYPPLETGSSPACQAAWNTLQYVRCHEKIWNRSWDDGKQTSLFDPDITVYAAAMCTSQCTQAINRAFQLISSQCTEDDQFDKINFQGPFSVDPGLEDGPVGAISTIARRLTHTCREKPLTDPYYYNTGYCAANLFADWGIVDGMNAGNLEGLDRFESRTRIVSSTPPGYEYKSIGDSCDNLPSYYPGRRIESRRYGPYVNSTTCDWCTMNWFERKLLSWKKGAIKDPKTDKPVSLKQYLTRIKKAGQRCDADAWDRTYEKALRKYKQSGDLPYDWDDKVDVGDGDDNRVGDGKKGSKGSKGGKNRKPCKDDKKSQVGVSDEEEEELVHIMPVSHSVPN